MALLLVGTMVQSAGLQAEEAVSRCCEKERSVEEVLDDFDYGYDLLRSEDQERSLEPLCSAACCLPHPDANLKIRHAGLIVRYQPFYWLGVAYLELDERDDQDLCRALRYLNLAICERKRVKDKAQKEKLVSPEKRAREARKQARKVRNAIPAEFQAGFEHFDDKEWRLSALNMLEAIRTWDEDGELTKIQGRFWENYLPRYVLARALLELNCTQEAVKIMRCSELSWCLLWTDDDDDEDDDDEDKADDPRNLVSMAEEQLAPEGQPEQQVCGELRELMNDLDLDGCCACAGC